MRPVTPSTNAFTLTIILCVMTSYHVTYSSKILMTGAQIRSHMFDQLALAEELVSRGHEIYYAVASRCEFIPTIQKKGIQVLTYHIPPDVRYHGADDVEEFSTSLIFDSVDAEDRLRREANALATMLSRDCTFMMEDRDFLEALKNIKFDIAVVEPFLFCPCTMLLPKHLGIRFITMASVFVPWNIRVPALPSFYSLLLTNDTKNSLNFSYRLNNLILYLVVEFNLLFKPDTDPLIRYTEGYLSYDQLLLESELFIVVCDHLLDSVMPLMPNFVRLPGITSRPSKPLPEDLEQLIASAKEGVILMTFGSSITRMPDKIVKNFLDAFGMLNQTVVAKIRVPDGWAIPKNLHIRSWLPQNDILGHANVKLFITHCGNGGQYEALYHGVPMLGFPLFAEQPSNARRAAEKGFGLFLDIHSFTSTELFNNIQEMLTNPSYTTAIRKMSAVLHDEPMNSREKASFWIEHVIKHGGKHLRSIAMDMPVYQFLMIDVIALVFIILLLVLVLLSIIIYCVVRKLCSRKSTTISSTRKDQ